MEEIISKEELKEIKKIKGEVRGMGMRTHADFILKKEGKKGLEKLESTLVKIGQPIRYKEIKKMAFYPLYLEGLTLVAIQKIFNYGEKEFQEIGIFHSKFSIIFLLFLKRFFSFEKIAKEIPNVWNKYFSNPGKFEVVEFSDKNRRAVFRIKKFYFHPLHCQVMRGVLKGLIPIVSGYEGTCEETKCIYRGDEYHEYVLKW